MSKLKKCLYLINLLERKGALTLKEINDCYQYSSLYEGDEILPRTFTRYKDYIAETFPCYIEYNQRTGKYELHRLPALRRQSLAECGLHSRCGSVPSATHRPTMSYQMSVPLLLLSIPFFAAKLTILL